MSRFSTLFEKIVAMNAKKVKVTVDNQTYDLTGVPTEKVVLVLQKALELNDAIEEAKNSKPQPTKGKPQAWEDEDEDDEDNS
jgi:hypothetical protein